MKAREIMLSQLRRLDMMISGMRGACIADDSMLQWFESARSSLHRRMADLAEKLNE